MLGDLSRPSVAWYTDHMLELSQVDEVVNKAVSAALKKHAGITHVISEPTSDSQGDEALHITIVLKSGSADKITGETALNALVSVDRALREAGDDRFPIIDYVTEDELASSDDAES